MFPPLGAFIIIFNRPNLMACWGVRSSQHGPMAEAPDSSYWHPSLPIIQTTSIPGQRAELLFWKNSCSTIALILRKDPNIVLSNFPLSCVDIPPYSFSDCCLLWLSDEDRRSISVLANEAILFHLFGDVWEGSVSWLLNSLCKECFQGLSILHQIYFILNRMYWGDIG